MRAIELIQQHLVEFRAQQKQQTPQQQQAVKAFEKITQALRARAKKHLSLWDRINNLPEEEGNF